MAKFGRFFANNLPDYEGENVKISEAEIISKCLDLSETIFKNHKATAKKDDGGLYVGNAGIAYMCYYLANNPKFAQSAKDLFAKGESYLKCSLVSFENTRKTDKPHEVSFLLGGVGVYTVAAALAASAGQNDLFDSYVQRYASSVDICLSKNFLSCGENELFVGRAGYLCGILFLKKRFGVNVIPDEKLFALCQAIIDSGMTYAKRKNSACPLMFAYYKTEYLGAAHGLSYILQILLSFPDFLDSRADVEKCVKAAVDFVLMLQLPSGNFPCAMDEVQSPRPELEELVHWCHGAAGVVYLMAAAYLRWKENKYLESCLKCGEVVWRQGLLKKGPGICHGVAGSGYVFLLLYRLTKNPLHLHRAAQFANFIFTEEFRRESRTPDSPYSLYEGFAGTVCFLSDLLQPSEAHFPFSDVF